MAFIWLSVTHIIKLSAVIPERYLLIVSKFVIEDMQLLAKSFSANDCNLKKKIKFKLKSKNFNKKNIYISGRYISCRNSSYIY